MSNFVCWWITFLSWVSILFFPPWLSILQRFCELSGGGKKKERFFGWARVPPLRPPLRHSGPAEKPSLFFHHRSLRKKVQNINQGAKKKYHPRKKIITKNEVIIQRKHHYLYNKIHSIFDITQLYQYFYKFYKNRSYNIIGFFFGLIKAKSKGIPLIFFQKLIQICEQYQFFNITLHLAGG